jgi:hypothetical protein
MKNLSLLAVLLSSAFLASAAPQTPVKPAEKQQAPAKTADDKAKPSDKDVIREQKPAYPLTTCVISGHALGKSGDPIDQVVNGRLVRLCCADCVAPVTKDPSAAIRKVDEAVVAAQKATYPMKTCPVTGEALGSGAVNHVYGTRLVILANADAVAQFDKDPKSAMAKVDKALIDAQLATYPLKTCVVSDEALTGDASMVPFDYLYGTTLVRLCCKSCVRTFEKDPAANLKKIAAAK